MRTSKPFSMISYNTTDFLRLKLNELRQDGLIQFWAFIEHLPEEDEEKPHKHLYIIPAKLIDTRRIEEALQEIDLNDLTAKPLGAIFPRPSKFDDWYLYALHDKKYLAYKGQKRQYHYNDNAFIVSCPDTFRELKNLIDYTEINRLNSIIEKAENGESLADIIKTCNVPLQLIGQVKQLYNIIVSSIDLYRNDRTTHTPKSEDWVELAQQQEAKLVKLKKEKEN